MHKVQFQSLRGVAQLVARTVWDREVAGSSPATPTCAGVAQLVERLPSKQNVAGPSPVSRSQRDRLSPAIGRFC